MPPIGVKYLNFFCWDNSEHWFTVALRFFPSRVEVSGPLVLTKWPSVLPSISCPLLPFPFPTHLLMFPGIIS